MKKSIVLAITILIALFGMYAAERDAAALDAPHNTNNQTWSITCSRCHYSPTGPTPTWVTLPTTTDDTFKNNLCKDCHSASGMPAADPRFTDVKTHSATETASSYRSGKWTIECVVCHSPHYQQQSTNAAYSAQPGVNALTGTVTSIASTYGAASSTLTDTAASFPVNGYVGYLLVPNINYPTRVYRISANDATTFTVDGAININYAPATGGSTYAIRYGKMINANMVTPYSGLKQVKFFNETGANSFGSGVNAVCQVCHTLTTSFKNDGTKEAGAHPAGVAETQACTDCHAHAAGFKVGGCTNCHGSPPVDSGTLVFKSAADAPVTSDSNGPGAHLKHTTSGRLSCDNCHTGGMLSGASQGDNLINIGFRLGGSNIGGNYDGKNGRSTYPYGGGGSTTVSATGTHNCSSVYCHSTGQSLDGTSATPVYATPSWNSPASGACGTCHNTTTISTGNHSQHLAATTLVAGCAECHTGAANDASSYTSTNHVNRLIDVANNYNAGGTPGNNYGTCVATACHGSGTPTWGTSTAGMDKCTLCHGTATAGSLGSSGAAMAPPVDTARASSGAKVGAHQAHLVANSVGRTVACAECHNVPAAIDTAGHIKDGTPGVAEVPFTAATSTVARANGATPSYSGGNCSSVYCHGANQWGGSAQGADMTPSWADTNYINGTATHDCAQCHGYPPLAISAHAGKVATDCVDCHNNTNAAGTGFTNVADHVNGVLEVTGCNACHGQSGPTGAPLVLNDLLRVATGYPPTHASQTQPGAHNRHVTSTELNMACSICHAGHTMPTLDSVITMSFTGVAAGGTYDGKTLINGYSYSPNVTLGTPATLDCNNLYCHSSGQSATGGAPPVYANPNWETSTMNCGTCHKNMDTDVTAPGSHGKHAQSSSIACATCHNGYTETTYAAATHVNQTVNVSFSGAAAGTLYTGGSTSGNHAVGGGYGSCYTSSCHSSGQSATGAATPLTYGNPTWGGTLNCGSCHKNMDSDGTAPGSHVQHAQGTMNIACATCHNGYTETTVAAATHNNSTVNTSFTGTAAGTLYTGGSTSGNHALGGGYGSCFTNQCHGANNPTWGANTTNDTCTKCHGTGTVTVTAANKNVVAPPTSVAGNTGTWTDTGQVSSDAKVGAHQTHLLYSNGVRTTGVETIENRCEFCHGTLPTSGMHANGSSTPAFQGLATKSGAMTPGYAGTTCNNTYCHNPAGAGGVLDASSAGTGTAPVWTNAAYIADGTLKTAGNCGVCHKVPEATPNPLWNYSSTHSAMTIATDCSSCHGHNGGSTGAVGQRHIDGIRYAAGNCNSCHDYDVVGATFAAGVWTGGTWGKNSQDGLSPNEGWGAHAKHINHIKTKLAIGTALDPTNQTFGTATPASVCGVCHTNTGSNHTTGGSVTRTINFGDGSTTYAFGSNPVYNGASGVTSATTPKTCSNLSCHFKATPVWSTF